jgi:hypothetical protein
MRARSPLRRRSPLGRGLDAVGRAANSPADTRARRVGWVAAASALAVSLGTFASLVSGCYATDRGPEPPASSLYFPTGVAISPGGKALFVANSDFDLQYTRGTVQVLDLPRLRAMLPHPTEGTGETDCAAFGLAAASLQERALRPGPCGPIDLNAPPDGAGSLIRNTVKVGAFAAEAAVVLRPTSDGAPGARLVIPVRGDPSLTWFDIDDDRTEEQTFRLDCAQGSSDGCADSHRAGTDPTENSRALTMPKEPINVAVSGRGDAIVTTHQTSGAVSLFLNGWSTSVEAGRCTKTTQRPELSFVLGGLPAGAMGVTAVPVPRYSLVHPEVPYTPAFLVTYRNAAQIDIIRYLDDCASAPSRPFLTRAGVAGVNVNSTGYDSRGIALDPRARQACEDACDATDDNCLTACGAVPMPVYVANRTPATLLIGQTRSALSAFGSADYVEMYDQIPLSQGASKVVIGNIIGKDGLPKTRVFILCFDARLLYVYDPAVNAIEAAVLTGRGPATLVFDPNLANDAPYAYVAHFTDSYLGVLDLDMRNPETYLTFVATVGVPSLPRESK